jgi:hypothetical protein
MRHTSTANTTRHETDATFTRAYWGATKVLWIDILLTFVILSGVVSRL